MRCTFFCGHRYVIDQFSISSVSSLVAERSQLLHSKFNMMILETYSIVLLVSLSKTKHILFMKFINTLISRLKLWISSIRSQTTSNNIKWVRYLLLKKIMNDQWYLCCFKQCRFAEWKCIAQLVSATYTNKSWSNRINFSSDDSNKYCSGNFGYK